MSVTFTGNRNAKLLQLYEALDRFILVNPGIRCIIYERPFSRGLAATRMGWGMAGVIEMTAEQNLIGTVDMPPTTIKKWLTGSGKADKDLMMEFVQAHGYTPKNDHEADAIAFRLYGEAKIEDFEWRHPSADKMLKTQKMP